MTGRTRAWSVRARCCSSIPASDTHTGPRSRPPPTWCTRACRACAVGRGHSGNVRGVPELEPACVLVFGEDAHGRDIELKANRRGDVERHPGDGDRSNDVAVREGEHVA